MQDFKQVGKMRRSVGVFVTLLLFWVLLNGNLAPDTLVIGAVTALVITLFFSNGLSVISEFRFTPGAIVATVQYVFYFLKELIKANVHVARIVLSPALPVKPGIVKVRTTLKSRMGRLLLANSITLTPGTMTVDIQGEWLFIHWISVDHDDIDGATADIVAGFERYLEAMYG